MRVATPNDPKLSDGGGWRGPCMAGGKAAAEARAVTATPVRCSAWLGASADWRKPFIDRRVRGVVVELELGGSVSGNPTAAE